LATGHQPAKVLSNVNSVALLWATPFVISVIRLMTNVTNFARRVVIASRHWTILLEWADGPSIK